MSILVCLYWCATYFWDNSIKYLVLSPIPLRSYIGSTALSSKICYFGVTLSPILCQVFMEAATKYFSSLILSWVGSACVKNKKAPSSLQIIFACVMHTCSTCSLVIYPLLQPFKNHVFYLRSQP